MTESAAIDGYNSAMAKTTALRRAALGFRVHSGWGALVAVSGSPSSPEIIARRRIEIADPKQEGSKQPFHAAEPLELPHAEELITCCSESTQRLAREAIRAAVDGLRDRGYIALAVGLTLGSGRTLPALPQILASHALIHTAEGEFFRQAVSDASKYCGLKVHGVKEKELFDCGATLFRTSTEQLCQQITAIGKSIGPPWTMDQKYAALAAWIALAEINRGGGSRG